MPDVTEKENMFVSAVIVSAGNSTRMGGINKQFLELHNIPVIAYTISAFEKSSEIDEIVIVTKKDDIDEIKNIIKKYDFKKVAAIVEGGGTRQKSVLNGVKATQNASDFIAVHDGARPLVSEKTIELVLAEAIEFGAATTGVKVKDTVKIVNSFDEIVDTPDRSSLRLVHTPQIFKKTLYLDAVASVENSENFTDDCMLIEAYGRVVKFVDGDYENIKITTPDDVALAECYLSQRRR